jgi:hypothetical protein
VGSPSTVSLGPTFQQNAVWSEYNRIYFAISQAIAKVQTATLVQIMAVTNAGEVEPVGFVDIMPLVNQVDGNGNPTPHVTIYNIPYLRIQGGTNAIIIDPQVGDIGIAVFTSRDISKVKSTKAQANPGSGRMYDFADGLYLGGVLNGTPQQFVCFSTTGIEINSPTKITLTAPEIDINGQVQVSQGINATDDIIGAGISLQTHTHTSESPGSPTSAPIP